MEYGNENRDLRLYKSAVHGNWSTASRIFAEDSDALTAKIFGFEETILHVAITAGHSIEFVQKLADKMTEDMVGIENRDGNNPLHCAAMVGNTEAAKIYVTRDEHPSPFAGEDGVRLLNALITADFYAGIALDLLKHHLTLARGRDQYGFTALYTLSKKPQAFASGSHLGFCQRLICGTYFSAASTETTVTQGGDVEYQIGGDSEEHLKESKKFQFLQLIENTMLMHKQAMKLLKILISEVLKASDSEIYSMLGPATINATRLGIQEFVAEAIKSFPYVVWHRDQDGSKLNPSNKISGAALQMQRELQWFQEVEKVVQPSFKENIGEDGHIPRILFTKEHKNLVETGEMDEGYSYIMRNSCSTCDHSCIRSSFYCTRRQQQ
ncbi:hypothetical protein GH714_016707 [Hevea brasiliensis]|uniref:Uncharacterized protein n=1 Tax=Hevea brasiliensis TaxID=3981 RepID=A0A6A6KXM4_HEVBR|nr:hypothetical protein GH714_016707 [Hevea brasiliensis]